MDCDWCGQPFAEGEQSVPGYKDLPTHRECRAIARREWDKDRGVERDLSPPEREPFTDWPNGQGTYD